MHLEGEVPIVIEKAVSGRSFKGIKAEKNPLRSLTILELAHQKWEV